MPRYVSKPKASGWIEDEDAWQSEAMVPNIAARDHEHVDTGLLDASGNSIWRAPNGCGFTAEIE